MFRTKLFASLLVMTAACGSIGNDPDPEVCNDFTSGVSTLAGQKSIGNKDGDRCTAKFHNPTAIAVGPDGRIYVADFDNDAIRVLDTEGNTSTLIKQQGFSKPFGLVFVGSTLYAATDNNDKAVHSAKSGTIWRVDIGAKKATPVLKEIGRARGMVGLKDGRIAFADYESHVICIWNPATGAMFDLAGARGQAGSLDGIGNVASFNQPYELVQRADGSLLVTDWANNKLRLVTLDGKVTTLAGSGQGFADGAMGSARFSHPQSLAQASNGDIFFTDLGNMRIRKIDAGLTTVTTVAGDGNPGPKDADDPMAAEFYGLEGITVTPDGAMVYFTDGSRGDDGVKHNLIRQLAL